MCIPFLDILRLSKKNLKKCISKMEHTSEKLVSKKLFSKNKFYGNFIYFIYFIFSKNKIV